MSNVDTTPSTRAVSKSAPDAMRQRVNKIYPSGRCLIENIHPYNSVHYCHCLDRSTQSSILTQLEHAWGMKQNSLNLDSRYNIIRLGANLHNLFDKLEWILLPEKEIIQSFHVVRNDPIKIPNINNETYKYHFLSHPRMAVTLIHRQHNVNPEKLETVVNADDSTTHSFPFSSLGLVESHVHPKFAIAKIGQGLSRSLLNQYLREHPHFFQSLSTVIEIYDAWVTIPASSLAGDPFSGEKPNDNDDESNSTKTKSRRARSVVPTGKRQRTQG